MTVSPGANSGSSCPAGDFFLLQRFDDVHAAAPVDSAIGRARSAGRPLMRADRCDKRCRLRCCFLTCPSLLLLRRPRRYSASSANSSCVSAIRQRSGAAPPSGPAPAGAATAGYPRGDPTAAPPAPTRPASARAACSADNRAVQRRTSPAPPTQRRSAHWMLPRRIDQHQRRQLAAETTTADRNFKIDLARDEALVDAFVPPRHYRTPSHPPPLRTPRPAGASTVRRPASCDRLRHP